MSPCSNIIENLETKVYFSLEQSLTHTHTHTPKFNSSSPRKFAGPQQGKYSRSKLSFLAGTMLKLQGGKVVPSNFKVNQNNGLWLVGCSVFGEGSEEKCRPEKRELPIGSRFLAILYECRNLDQPGFSWMKSPAVCVFCTTLAYAKQVT